MDGNESNQTNQATQNAENQNQQAQQNQNAENQQQNQGSNENSGEKTFTQSELSVVAATEKKQGKQAILNLFGLKDEKSAKAQAEEFKKWQEQQKTLDDKVKEQTTTIEETSKRAQLAENKLACVMAGVNKDSVEDALAIATLKVTEEKSLEAVLEEMKKETRYAGFFNSTNSQGSKGTGTSAGHEGTGNTGGAVGNIGERLGKAKQATVKKSNFFTN